MSYAAYFAALVDDVQPTVGSVRHIRIVALSHLREFAVTWNVITDSIRAHQGRSVACWYLLDGVLRDVPWIYGGYAVNDLPKLCLECMPLHEEWAGRLLRYWADLMPVEVAPLVAEASAAFARARIDDELASAMVAGDLGKAAETLQPATADDLRELEEVTERLVSQVARRRQASNNVKIELASVKAEPGLLKQEQTPLVRAMTAALSSFGNTKDAPIDADEEYAPDYVAGARMGHLAELVAPTAPNDGISELVAGNSTAPQQRQKRVRPR